jgi:hypothetical protein
MWRSNKPLANNMKIKFLTLMIFLTSILPLVAPVVYAQAQVPPVNLNDPGFRLVNCDGPAMPNAPAGYRPCDFEALIAQGQYLINIMITVGVFAALVGFAYSGYLYVTGSEGNISKAKSILPKIAWGFLIMLTAWFVVYQILQWLTGDASTYLRGVS